MDGINTPFREICRTCGYIKKLENCHIKKKKFRNGNIIISNTDGVRILAVYHLRMKYY